MIKAIPRIILATTSTVKISLFKILNLEFEAHDSNYVEDINFGALISDEVLRLAKNKALILNKSIL